MIRYRAPSAQADASVQSYALRTVTAQGPLLKVTPLLAGILVFAMSVSQRGYALLFLLPTTYGLLNILVPPARRVAGRISLSALHAVLYWRYVIVPVAIVLLRAYSGAGPDPSSDSMILAVVLMLYEMLAISLTVRLFGPSLLGRGEQESLRYTALPASAQIVLLLLVVGGVAVAVTFPQVRQIYNLSSNLPVQHELQSSLWGLLLLVVDWAKLLCGLLIVVHCKYRYDQTHRVRYVIYSFIAFLPSVLIISRTSRNSILFPAAAMILLMSQLYPRHRKRLVLAGFVCVAAVIALVTLAKNFGIGVDEGRAPTTASERIPSFLQAYGCTVRDVALSAEIAPMIRAGERLPLIISDIFASVPLLDRMTDQSNTSTALYNQRIYGWFLARDQIVPLVSQGYLHFSLFGAPTYTVVFLVIAMALDRRARRARHAEFYYIYTLAALRLATSSALANATIVVAAVCASYLPMYVILRLNRATSLARADRRVVSSHVK